MRLRFFNYSDIVVMLTSLVCIYSLPYILTSTEDMVVAAVMGALTALNLGFALYRSYIFWFVFRPKWSTEHEKDDAGAE